MADRPILFSAPMIRALLREVDAPGTGKTQTRRILKPQPIGTPWFWAGDEVDPSPAWFDGYERGRAPCGAALEEVNDPLRGLRIAAGDRLWVREKAAVRYQSWHHADGHKHSVSYAADENENGQYIATGRCGGGIRRGEAPSVFPRRSHRNDGRLQWCPSIHMPKWASRLTLYVTGVKVERLQDISEADAWAEGVETFCEGQDRTGWGDMAISARRCIVANIYGSASMAYAHLWDTINGPGAWEANPWVYCLSFKPVLGNIDSLPPSVDG